MSSAPRLKDKKRVLLVGTSYSAAPLLDALRNLGFSVDACGAYREDPCALLADAYHCIDYADRDALLNLASAGGYDYLCPSCNDTAYLASAYVAEKLGMPGFDRYETASLLHDKARFRAFAQSNHLPVPRAIVDDGIAENAVASLRPPLLVKPTDSFSGRGVTRIESTAQLAAALTAARGASRASRVVIEEFIEGSLHSHSAFLHDGRIVEDFFVDEFCEVYPYQVDCSNHPSRLTDPVRATVRKVITQLAEVLALADGLLHTQFIHGPAGTYIIECMRRCPGDLYYHLIEFSTGARYIENYVAAFTGKPPCAANNAAPMPCEPWARHTVSFARDTVFYSLGQHIPAREVRTFPLCQSASLIRAAPYGKAAILFARFSSGKEAFALTQNLRHHLTLSIKDPADADNANQPAHKRSTPA